MSDTSDTTEWFDNNEFWATFGPCMFDPERFEQAIVDAGDLLRLTGISSGKTARVLDLGCGPGRHSVPLAEMGLKVTGIDLSRHLLDQGQAYAASRGVDVNWLECDMRAFPMEQTFDLITSLWTSFGYFDDPGDDLTLLKRCARALRPGGKLVLDTIGKEYVCANIQPVHLTEYDDGRLLVERPFLDQALSRYNNEWILIDGDHATRYQWHHSLYCGSELANLLRSAGFENVQVYGSLTGDEYDLDAQRLVVVGSIGDCIQQGR